MALTDNTTDNMVARKPRLTGEEEAEERAESKRNELPPLLITGEEPMENKKTPPLPPTKQNKNTDRGDGQNASGMTGQSFNAV